MGPDRAVGAVRRTGVARRRDKGITTTACNSTTRAFSSRARSTAAVMTRRVAGEKSMGARTVFTIQRAGASSGGRLE